MLGVNYYSVYRLTQRGKLLIPQTKLLELLRLIENALKCDANSLRQT